MILQSSFACLFFSISLREFFNSSLNTLLKLFFKLFSSVSSVFGYSNLVVVGPLGFVGVVLLYVVLSVFIPCLPIFSSDW